MDNPCMDESPYGQYVKHSEAEARIKELERLLTHVTGMFTPEIDGRLEIAQEDLLNDIKSTLGLPL